MSRTIQPGAQFASDNASGICPEAWEALAEANEGYAAGYGDDGWTARAADELRECFEADCEVYFTCTGTAANALSLAASCRSYHSAICSEVAHAETDECGGPEFFSNGIKLLLAPHNQGKVTPEGVEKIVRARSDIHYPKPRALSLTQATELGTVYTTEELRGLAAKAEELGLTVHMDGARLGNAVASLGVAPRAVTWEVGVDVLALGGTKSGLPFGEAVLFFNHALAEEFDYRCKQAGQLASKMRFIAAPWVGLLRTGGWLKHARHANACAARLEAGVAEIDGARLRYPREANSVFVELPDRWVEALWARGWKLYTFIGTGGVRLMCSWQTTEAETDALLADLRAVADDAVTSRGASGPPAGDG